MELIFLVSGLFIFVVAIAIYSWVYIVKKGELAWNTPKNRKYLISDAFIGFIVLMNSVMLDYTWFQFLFGLAVVASIVTHFRRDIEYFLKKQNPFSSNQVLLGINNLKLVLLFGLLFSILPF